MSRENLVKEATLKFQELIWEQFQRIDAITSEKEFTNYQNLDKIIIGCVGGDGIGPAITGQAKRVLEFLLKEQVSKGKIEFRDIENVTIEERIKQAAAIPESAIEELKACHVILKGPTTTPDSSYKGPNIESANVAMRKVLDLFANVRPVRVVEEGINWTFFRENTEGAYAVGSKGVHLGDELALDFVVATQEGTTRIIRSAFEFAKANKKTRVTVITKANVIKTTDGKFLKIFKEIAKEYPEIAADDWYIDIMTAKLIDKKRRSDFQVMVLPNLYGDILTDEAAEFQGGVGTAGSANIGKKYAMFEAIHGSAPRMVEEGRAQYADPSSIMRGAAMLLAHIGFNKEAEMFTKALDYCMNENPKFKMTGRSDGATNSQYADYIMETIESYN